MELGVITSENLAAFQTLLLPETVRALADGKPVTALGLVQDRVAVGACAGSMEERRFQIHSFYVAPAYTQITDHIDTLDISNSEEDRELLILLGYLHAVQQRLAAYFGNQGADVKAAAAAGQSRFKPRGEAGKEGEALKGLGVLASFGTEYLRRYFPGIPGLTEIEKLEYDQDPKEYLKLMVE